jgi:DNA sulfur modification protein DndC
MTRSRQASLFDDQRLTLREAVDLSLASLRTYGERYPHWALAYSGGKDSTATASFVAWAIKTGQVSAPASLTILYADTRQELTPLWAAAQSFMDALRADGFDARVVLPALDNRFYVYMLGRGVPPPTNRFRWCTPKLKIEPMERALDDISWSIDPMTTHIRQLLRDIQSAALARGDAKNLMLAAAAMPPRQKFLQITGVRQGESAARDARIALSCSKDSGECGQGWFQAQPADHIGDTLAPLVHWRLCWVWDWLYFGYDDAWMKQQVGHERGHGYPGVGAIAAAYGDEDARTGCIGCNLASHDTALERLVKTPQWSHLAPLLELKPLFTELKKPRWRLRKASPDRLKDGSFAKNGQRMGPLTMAGRAYGLERVLDIQKRAGVDLISAEEEARIRELWADDTWPDGWTGDEVTADEMLDRITSLGTDLVVQPLLAK